MKYCRFETDAGPQYGEVVDRAGTLWIERLLPPFEEDPQTNNVTTNVTKPVADAIEPIPLTTARLLAPVVPRKIIGVGRNYREHASELGNEPPKEPLIFLKASSSVIGPQDSIRIPWQSQRVDFEGELAIVIGKRASKIGPDEPVAPYIRGYTIVNDVTARDLQKSDAQWTRAKGFDTFCPIGPLVTNEIDPTAGVTVETRLNGELRQRGNTRDFIFPIDTLLRYITAAMTLCPGDLIPTGTPAGVGPMQPGDVVEVSIEDIGVLQNRVL